MKKQSGAIDFSSIEKAIVTVKGQNVIIDSDVARIYGVETKEVNQAVKNNLNKFPLGYIVDANKEFKSPISARGGMPRCVAA